MSKSAPEVTVLVRKVVRNKKAGRFELHIGKILEVRNLEYEARAAKSNLMPLLLNGGERCHE